MASAAVCSVALLLHTSVLCGQTVSGEVVDSATDAPIRAIVVVLLDSTGAQRGATLADSAGRFTLHAAAPGTYRVRSRQIGIVSTTSRPIFLPATSDVSVILRVRPLSVALPVVATVSRQRCSALDDVGEVGALWDEVGKALTAVTITPSVGTPEATLPVRNFVRELDPHTLKVRSERTDEVRVPAQMPYVSPAPDTLAKYGFVVPGTDGTSYYAPDARTLISDAFASGHCLSARPSDAAHPGLVGVAFEPVQRNRARDIRGTLWLDMKTSRLQYLEYSYTGEPSVVPAGLAGGRVDFAALPSGAWIVRNWVIRMPKFARGYGNDGLGTYSVGAATDSVFAGVVEIGGTVLGQRNATYAETKRTVGVTSAATDSAAQSAIPVSRNAVLFGSVLTDPNDGVVAGAEVTITPEHSTHTDSAGKFRIAGIPPGSYMVVVRHLGSAPISASLTFTGGDSLARDFVLVPAPPALETVDVRAQRLLSAVALGKMAGFEDRRRRGIGHFVDTTTLRKENFRSLGQILQAHFPVKLLVIDGSGYVTSQRGIVSALVANEQPAGDASDRARGAVKACYSQVFVDGVRVYEPAQDVTLFDVNSIPVTSVQAVEYFSGPAETPSIYGGTGASCGTVLIWTR